MYNITHSFIQFLHVLSNGDKASDIKTLQNFFFYRVESKCKHKKTSQAKRRRKTEHKHIAFEELTRFAK